MNNTIKYKNPPLVESVFELFFSTRDWNSIIPGLFYSEVKNRFPIISQNQSGLGVSFDGMGGLTIGGGRSEITQYRNDKNDTVIQLANNMLSVNKLPEYKGWEDFLEIITYAIDVLKKVLKIEKIERIGLKSINKIDIKIHSLDELKRHFLIYPNIPQDAEINPNALQLNLESPTVDKKEVLTFLLATLKPEQNYIAPVMFQYYLTRISDVPDNLQTWLNESHIKINDLFNKSLTEYSKNTFNQL